jgi:trans-aconitate methyltransferase
MGPRMRGRSDRDWEELAREDPYYSVLTAEKFRKKNLTGEALDQFFHSGETYIDDLFAIIRAQLDPSFSPASACDFGCGVGRLVVPLGRRCSRVVGIDVSETMLSECRANLAKRAVETCELVKGDDRLSGLTGQFDLIHSFIVFQHIPVGRGLAIVQRLLEHTTPRGVVVLHFKYYPYRERSPLERTVLRVASAVRERLRASPIMQMNAYPLNELFSLLQRHEMNQCHVRFSQHGPGQDGVLIAAQRNPDIRHAGHF